VASGAAADREPKMQDGSSAGYPGTAVGPARVGLGASDPTELSDTLRLQSLPTMTLDVTDGDIHLELVGSGKLRVGGAVTGAPANHLSAIGRHIVVLKGGIGVRSGDAPEAQHERR
jgi:hypothetical protein